MPKICIIGAGITGLSHAWQLQQAGHSVTVLESGGKVGGPMTSHYEDGFLAEEGPHSIIVNSQAVADFLESIPGLSNSMVEANPNAKKRFIVRDGKVLPLPASPLQAVTTPLLSFSAKLRLLKEPFITLGDSASEESIAEFVRRRLGDEPCDYLVNPFVGGIYAGDPERLSLAEAFPKLAQMEASHGSLIKAAFALKKASKGKFKRRIISFKSGIAELPLALAQAMETSPHTGVSLNRIHRAGTAWQVDWTNAGGREKTEQFDQIVLSIPAHRLDQLPLLPEIKEALAPFREIKHPPVSVLSLGFKNSAITHPLDGFGMLVPKCENRQILGVLFPSGVFDGRAPEGHTLLSVFVGGARQPELATSDTASVLKTVIPELEAFLGINAPPEFVHHKHWQKAIPQYTLGYAKYKQLAESIETGYPGIRLAGNFRTGISVTNCIESGLNFEL